MNATLDVNVKPMWNVQERTFTSFDGTELFYRTWTRQDRFGGLAASAPSFTHAILLFHRGHEHSARWHEFVQALDMPDAAVFAWDARGHGRSPGERGWAPDLATVIKDADVFARHITSTYGVALSDMAVVAHSVGAVAAAAWVHDYAPPIRALVLATPALRVKLYVPLAIPSLRALSKVKPKSFVKSYVRSKMLTHDPAQAATYDANPLISKQIAVNILLDLHDTATRLIADAGAIATPTLVLGAGSDWVVKNAASMRFFERLSSPTKSMHVFPRLGHSIFHELDRAAVVDRVRSFLDRQFAAPSAHDARLNAVTQYTRREYEKLSKPSPAYCPKGMMFKVQRFTMKTALKLSAGIRVGWRTGFDSGQSLDYVYRNKPTGHTPLGKLIDHFYLNAIGWRGIRLRGANLSAAIRAAIRAQNEQGRPARLLDIAAGPGRYVLESIAALPEADVSATLRDRSEPALAEGRALATKLNIAAQVRFEPGDAFNREQLAAATPRPNIAIVSGLYELFPDNAMIEQSLAGLADALAPGDTLIYTNQPWHPQVEMIARTLDNREGKPWVMRRRTQFEMDELVRRAGFEKRSMEIDRWGVFSVSVARRI